jgi:hypothetical protein
MKISELQSASKPLKPDQARIDALKRTKDAATKSLKVERDKQKLTKAQHTIAAVTTSIPKI